MSKWVSLKIKNMKANFRLEKSNVGVFIKRLEKLLSYTGMLETQSFYTGRKKSAYVLKQTGIKNHIELITQTITSYLDADTYQLDSYPSGMKIGHGEGLIIRYNTDSCGVIYWGQKMKFTPNKIIFIGDINVKKDKYRACGAREEFRIGHKVDYGKNRNHMENQYSKQYWSDVEKDYMETRTQ